MWVMADGPTVLFSSKGWNAVEAGSTMVPRLQSLLEATGDYFDLATGLPPGPAEAETLLAALPDGKSLDDKLVIGITENGADLIGVLDMIRNYPDIGTWYLGLFLLRPERRGQGIGTAIVRQLTDWVSSQGARTIRLGVKDQNPRALYFWRSVGFDVVESFPPRRLVNRVSAGVVMEHPCGGWAGEDRRDDYSSRD